MAQVDEASSPRRTFPFPNPVARAQFEFGGGRPLVSATDDCWRGLELLQQPSAEQSGRELQAMEWRRWNTRTAGGK